MQTNSNSTRIVMILVSSILTRALAMSCVVLFCAFSVYAQTTPLEMIPPAPEPAKLAQFALTPVGPYTGSHSLSVPVHTIDFDGMPINISLSYRSGGVRASEDAGEVGLGWGLNYTGTISRVMQGADDLLDGDNLDIGWPANTVNDGNAQKGYVYNGHEVPMLTNNWADASYTDFFYSEEASNLIAANTDTEPDIFSLSFFGASSKFVLSKADPNTGAVEIIKLSEDPNKITFDPVAQTFIVTNPQGFEGVFDVKAFSTGVSGSGPTRELACGSAAVDFYQGIIIGGRFRRITTWYLSKITSPRGRVLNFNYLGVADQGLSNDIYVSMSANTFGEKRAVHHAGYSPDEPPISCSRSMQEHIYPGSITSPELGINVTFLTDTRSDLKLPDFSLNGPEYQWSQFPNYYKEQLNNGNIKAPLKLAGILVTCDNLHSDLNRQITFQNDGYFNEELVLSAIGGEAHQYHRLRLDGVQVDDQVYRFDYYTGLPPKSTSGTDYWGFYNGSPHDQELLPAFVNPITMCGQIFGASFYKQDDSRKANFEYGKAGLLHTVTYPTGGTTQYEYESHEYQITEEEFSEGGSPKAVAGASQGDQTSKNAVEYIGYFTFPEAGSTCMFPVLVDVTLSHYNYWNNSECCEEVAIEDDQEYAVEIIDASTDQVVQGVVTWNRLRYNAEDTQDKNPSPYSYRQTYQLHLPKGMYKIRAKRKTKPDGTTKYFASATLQVADFCTEQSSSEFVVKTIKAGGARVKSVTNYDEYGKASGRKSYLYEKREFGQVFSSGVLMTPIRNVYISGKDAPPGLATQAACAYMITTASTIPLSSAAQGGHIGYTRVEEIVENGDGTKNIGKTIYEYENIPNDIINAQGSISNANVNGQLVRQTIYDNKAPQPKMVKRTEYDDRVTEVGEVRAMKYTVIPMFIQGERLNTFQFGASYTLKSQFVSPKKVTTTDYFENGELKQVVEYEFNPNYLLSKETREASNGDVLVTQYRRPSDYPSQSLALQKMIEKNQLSVVETIQRVGDQVVSARATHFVYDATNDLILSEKDYTFNEDKGSFTPSISGGSFIGGYDQEHTYQFDEKGNVVEILNRAGVGTVYLYGYNKSLPVAEIKNATWIAVKNSLGQAAIDALEGPPNETQLNQLKADLPGVLITTMTHSPQVGLSSMTTPDGRKTVYKYDSFGRLSVIEDADGNVLKYFTYQYKETLND